MTIQRPFAYIVFVVFLLLSVDAHAVGSCPPLSAASGTTVTVDSEVDLYTAVNSATAGTTILIADGTYHLGQNGYYLWIDTPNVTVRSASGDRETVILDDNYSGQEIITIAASNVTVADITIMRARTHPIHVVSTAEGHTLNTLIYNVHIIDPGQQAIKINPHENKDYFTDDGVVACSTIELTDAGRAKVWELNNSSCYTGGVDGHYSRDWVIRDNEISGFWCEQGLSEHGVHFWTGSRGTIVERNTFVNNARAVGFGLTEDGTGRTYADDPCPSAVGFVGHYEGIVRNNFIFANSQDLFQSDSKADGGIAFAQACGSQAVHNTIAFTSPPFAAIEWRFDNSDVDLINNLTTHNYMDRSGTARLVSNLSYQPLSVFVDGANGDLHLDNAATVAIDQASGDALDICDDDYDSQARPAGSAADIGADEYYSQSAGNTAPVAHDLTITVAVDSQANAIELTASDLDGDALTYSIATTPTHGTLGGVPPEVTYTPNAGYSGSDQFSFSIDDGQGGTDTGIVTLSVVALESGTADTGDSNDEDNGSGGGCFIRAMVE